MGIKKYIILSIILLISIAGYAFSLESGDYRIQILDQVIILPTAFWIVIPALLLFVATIMHLFYYGFKQYLFNRGNQKDNENLIRLIKKRLIGENGTYSFRSPEAKEIGDILSQVDFDIKDINFNTTNSDIEKIYEYITSIKSNKYVSSKKLKLALDNPLMKQNLKNRIEIDDNFSIDILKQPGTYAQDVVKYAFMHALQNNSLSSVKIFIKDINLDSDMLKTLTEQDSNNEDNKDIFDNSTILELIKSVDVSNDDLIVIGKKYAKVMTPEQLLKLFEDLSTMNEKFLESYLYILSEYQMIDEMREILVNSQEDEFIIFKAYLDLRDAGKHYSISSLY
ncbi:Probable membrane protein Cj0124c [hydrothermal vent metagenome]|uniref:Probable membrane protein Cj0124c n=1 Tax=hydrothermal vent metagenome TaxID=652676 RepID=A0A3B1E5A3_9ZZZZ